jgi:hypothetical protein
MLSTECQKNGVFSPSGSAISTSIFFILFFLLVLYHGRRDRMSKVTVLHRQFRFLLRLLPGHRIRSSPVGTAGTVGVGSG